MISGRDKVVITTLVHVVFDGPFGVRTEDCPSSKFPRQPTHAPAENCLKQVVSYLCGTVRALRLLRNCETLKLVLRKHSRLR